MAHVAPLDDRLLTGQQKGVTSVCIVGAGISGIACARALTDAGVRVEVVERAGRPGGRMASPTMGRWSGYGDRVIDSGAGYFTASDDEFRAVVDDWTARGLAREWTDTFHLLPRADGSPGVGDAKPGPMRYAAPNGLRSLVSDLSEGLDVRPDITVAMTVFARGKPDVDGVRFDAVVLAMPDPQAEWLLAADLSAEKAAVRERPWEPVLALLTTFPERSWADFDAGFVNDDDVLSFVADDGSRRGDGAPVLVAHSTAAFAAEHLDDPQAAAGPMAEALDRVLGVGKPEASRVHRWSYARPTSPHEEPFFFGPNHIGFCGDGWGSPKVETAWRSGTRLGRHVAEKLGS